MVSFIEVLRNILSPNSRIGYLCLGKIELSGEVSDNESTDGKGQESSDGIGKKVEPLTRTASGEIILPEFENTSQEDGVSHGAENGSHRNLSVLPVPIVIVPHTTRYGSVHEEMRPLVEQGNVRQVRYFRNRYDGKSDDNERDENCPKIVLECFHQRNLLSIFLQI